MVGCLVVDDTIFTPSFASLNIIYNPAPIIKRLPK